MYCHIIHTHIYIYKEISEQVPVNFTRCLKHVMLDVALLLTWSYTNKSTQSQSVDRLWPTHQTTFWPMVLLTTFNQSCSQRMRNSLILKYIFPESTHILLKFVFSGNPLLSFYLILNFSKCKSEGNINKHITNCM